MNVYVIYIDDKQGFFIVCAENEDKAKELIFTDEDSPLFEKENLGLEIDVYLDQNLMVDSNEQAILHYMFNENY